jgi:hypothetical protein
VTGLLNVEVVVVVRATVEVVFAADTVGNAEPDVERLRGWAVG